MEAIESGQVKLTGFVPAKQQIQFNVGVRPPPAVPPDFDPHRRRKLQEEAERIKKMNLSSTVIELWQKKMCSIDSLVF